MLIKDKSDKLKQDQLLY